MKDFEIIANNVGRKVKEPNLLRDIQVACKKKQAFIIGDSSTRVVLKPMVRDGVMYMLVWLGVSFGGDALAKFNPIVAELTRTAGGEWFEFCTCRKGFSRVAEKYGFERMLDDSLGRMRFRKMVR